ncbi:matrixin family metalloprotease [Nocardioides bruguierae]|uniref:Matrixin family metalloprotease n=1 Tax=Nocardioides bruguierae TaxID=2945102 RepID=A0A9X2D4Y9_9ACTN|nr:matrixin family metalloprotease [Nocardioides bruguierae]MCM0619512.1 matrixin family metalloprotease [Nocardioides bruguierae]
MPLSRGWYPDPSGDGERYHDGTRWTGVRRGVSAPVDTRFRPWSPPTRKPRRQWGTGLAVVAAIVVVGVVAVAGLTFDAGPAAPLTRSLGLGGSDRLLPVVEPGVTSQSYRFLQETDAGDPVTYDPCEPLLVEVNPEGGPADYLRFVLPALAEVQDASGLRLTYAGTSERTWDTQSQEQGSVLISFEKRLDSDRADAVGVGGSLVMTMDGAALPHYVSGAVALRQDWFVAASRRGETAQQQAVVMHELGHVLGLGHVDDPDQLMSAENDGQTAFGAGDLVGLALAGAGTCAG